MMTSGEKNSNSRRSIPQRRIAMGTLTQDRLVIPIGKAIIAKDSHEGQR